MTSPQMKKEFHPFCYEHHTQMTPCAGSNSKAGTEPVEAVTYVCSDLNCRGNYDPSRGYFFAGNEGDRTEQTTTPDVRCPNDGTPMYLAELHPEHKSYRLWKCPQCIKALTNLDSSQAL